MFKEVVSPYSERIKELPKQKKYSTNYQKHYYEFTLMDAGLGPILRPAYVGLLRKHNEDGKYSHILKFMPSTIAEIRPVGVKRTYDIEVADVHTLSANGFYTSNSRRSAMMGILNVDHPEIFDFINAKERVGFDVPLGFFNLSIGVVDGFMDAVINNKDWDLKFNGKVYKTVKAREILKAAIEHSFINGEPGILFLDNMNWRNNLWYLDEERIIGTNPCGEINGSYYTACLLGSFNLTKFIIDFGGEFEYGKLKWYIPIAVRLLDNVIDRSEYPLKAYEEKEKKNRLLGLGVTGLGDILVMAGKPYGSPESITYAESIMKFLVNNAYISSTELALEKGSFDNFIKDKYLEGNFIQTLEKDTIKKIQENGIRNASLMAIAPVGTGSIFANNVSSGIEPIFANEYTRRIRKDDGSPEEQVVMDYAYKLWKDKFNNKPLPDYWRTSNNITFEQHLNLLIAVQKYIDKSTSKTCILSHKPTTEEMINYYIKAWKNKLNGLTIFYPTDKTELVLESKNNKTKEKEQKKKKKRDFMLTGKTYKLKTPKEKYGYYVTINDFVDEEGNTRPFEIFINTKDNRQPIFSFIARLLSALFRREKDINFIIKEMSNTVVNGEGFFDPRDGKYVPSTIAYIGKIIKEHISSSKETDISKSTMFFNVSVNNNSSNKSHINFGVDESKLEVCPECGVKAVVNENGCKTCKNCGWTACT